MKIPVTYTILHIFPALSSVPLDIVLLYALLSQKTGKNLKNMYKTSTESTFLLK